MNRNAANQCRNHENDDVDLLYRCNVFVSLFSVSGLLSFKERIFQDTFFSGYFQIQHICNAENNSLNYVQCLSIASMGKVWFYEKLFVEVVIVTAKNKKIQYKRYHVNKN